MKHLVHFTPILYIADAWYSVDAQFSLGVLELAVQAIAENSYKGMQAHLVAFTDKELQTLLQAASAVFVSGEVSAVRVASDTVKDTTFVK